MKNLVTLDCEVYPNYTLFAFKNIDNKKVINIELKGENDYLSKDQLLKIKTIMTKRVTFGFNSNNFDIPIILYALKQKSCFDIFKLSSFIIKENTIAWQTMNKFELVMPKAFKHFDIKEVAKGVMISLKLYGGRLHSKKLQDLPIEPESYLTDDEMLETKTYCENDLDTNIDLYNTIAKEIQLRNDMSKKYEADLLSKSDAQIAETVIKSELQKLTRTKLQRPTLSPDTTFKYEKPSFISFKTKTLNDVLDIILNTNFELDKKGSIKLPDVLKKTKISIGNSVYKLGIGGLHSTEKAKTIIPTKNQLLIDKDVASYYPSIILNLGIFPRHLGKRFLDIYKNIVDERLEAKKKGFKVINESLKIVINGSFGKLGSKWSILYSPDLLLKVTLAGQLSLLMLIEELELMGVNVVSANTDGFVSLVDKDVYDKYERICNNWQDKTKFILEDNFYKALYSRDVNNYLAVTNKGCKGKGIFTLNSLQKNPQGDICIIAVIEFITNNTPLIETITNCTDVRKFLFLRKVTGGAIWRGEYLGKVVRFVYTIDGDKITYKKNDNKVAKSDGSEPVMTLGDLPYNIDYDRYIEEAKSILDDVGFNDAV